MFDNQPLSEPHQSRRIVLSAFGSRGDVNPFLGIALELKRRGHRPVVLLAETYQSLADDLGIESVPIISQDEFDRHLRYPHLWHPFFGPRFLIRELMVGNLPRVWDLLCHYFEPGNTILVSHPLDLASRCFRDAHHDVVLWSVHLAPLAIRNLQDPPRMGERLMGVRGPQTVVKLAWWLGDNLLIRNWLELGLNRFRQSLGLGPVRNPLASWLFSPDGVLCLFPSWYGPDFLDTRFRCVGFPRFDGPEVDLPWCDDANSDLKDFVLDRKPIVFTAGSAHVSAEKFYSAAQECCRQNGWDAVMLTKEPQQVPTPRAPSVRVAKYIALAQLLPYCRAIVHHGGIGTTSQALAAGLPQVVCPMAFDQFDNAMRVRRLGCGMELAMRRVSARSLGGTLTRLLQNEQLPATCGGLASRLPSSEETLAGAADTLLGPTFTD